MTSDETNDVIGRRRRPATTSAVSEFTTYDVTRVLLYADDGLRLDTTEITVRVAIYGNSLGKLRHPRCGAYSAAPVLLNKQRIPGGGAYLDCYPIKH